MYRKRIVFIPTYNYLSKNLFLSFVEKLKEDYDCIIINNDEYSKIEEDEYYKGVFDAYYEVNVNNEFKINPNLIDRFKKIFIKNFLLRKKFLSLIKEIKPDLIITNSDMSLAFKAIKKYCDNNNIYTVILQPSFFDLERITPFRINDLLRKFINIFSDYFPKQYLWGNEYKSNILFLWGHYFANFYKYQKIKIVGNALYDQPYQSNINLRKKLNLENKFVVTICTEAFGGLISDIDSKLLIKFYENIINYNEELYIILKVHPRESSDYFRNALELKHSNYAIIGNEHSLQDVLNITNVQVSVASATSLESIIFNTPIILINPNNQIKINNFFSGMVEEKATNIQEFQEKIHIIRTDKKWYEGYKENRKTFLELYCYGLGESSKNIKNEIDRVLLND